eukprot:TRINITY_DN19217_c0_g1_i1.p1 TRINITY_DN19217_c0_g1~~TRINITY_DN19217_c0_g1_i1.p1  ORF type:complete len:566 (-),score=146.83 TRINITY_DN19217_c0_g1_i1:70-1767(-)
MPIVRPFRYEVLSRRRVILWYVIYTLLLVLLALIGLAASDPTSHLQWTKKQTDFDYESILAGTSPLVVEFGPLSTLNRYFEFTIEFDHDVGSRVDAPVTVGVKVLGRENDGERWDEISSSAHDRKLQCDPGSEDCEKLPISMQPFIRSRYYRVETTFTTLTAEKSKLGNLFPKLVMGHDDFYVFQIAARYCFAMISIFAFWSFRGLCHQQSGPVRVAQKWIIACGIFLIGFNNPLYGLVYVFEGWFFPILDIILIGAFVAALLMLWISAAHRAGLEQQSKRMSNLRFVVPKAVLVIILTLSTFGYFLLARIRQINDPTSTGVEDTPGSNIMRWVSIASCIVYVTVLIYHLVRSVGAIGRPSLRIAALWVASTLSALILLVGLVFVIYGPVASENGLSFMLFFGFFNVYFCLIYVWYSPAPVEATVHMDAVSHATHMRLENDDDEEARGEVGVMSEGEREEEEGRGESGASRWDTVGRVPSLVDQVVGSPEEEVEGMDPDHAFPGRAAFVLEDDEDSDMGKDSDDDGIPGIFGGDAVAGDDDVRDESANPNAVELQELSPSKGDKS